MISIARKTVLEWLRENPALTWSLAMQGLLIVFALGAMPLDSRLILGINPWIKPLKFDVSVSIMLLTTAAILSGLQGVDGARRWIGAGVGIALTFEDVIISLQAFRGVRSHMNYSTPLNGGLFACMGVMIVVSTVLFAWLLGLVLRRKTRWEPAVALGVKLGLATLLIGSLEGFVMVAHGGHTIGGPDGLPGLPFVNWSRNHGDLRIPHFFALHALQAFPSLGWFLSRTSLTIRLQCALTYLGAVLYLGVVGFLFHLAMAGMPILGR